MRHCNPRTVKGRDDVRLPRRKQALSLVEQIKLEEIRIAATLVTIEKNREAGDDYWVDRFTSDLELQKATLAELRERSRQNETP